MILEVDLNIDLVISKWVSLKIDTCKDRKTKESIEKHIFTEKKKRERSWADLTQKFWKKAFMFTWKWYAWIHMTFVFVLRQYFII